MKTRESQAEIVARVAQRDLEGTRPPRTHQGRLVAFRGGGPRSMKGLQASPTGEMGPGLYWYTTASEARAYATRGGGILSALVNPKTAEVRGNIIITGVEGVEPRGYIPTEMTTTPSWYKDQWDEMEKEALSAHAWRPIKGKVVARIADQHREGSTVPIRVTPKLVGRTQKYRERWSLFGDLGIAEFDGSIPLYRVVDEREMAHILKSGRVTGGNFSAPAERSHGASWGYNITHVIQGMMSHRSRLQGDLFLLKIDGIGMEFLRLGLAEALGEDPWVTQPEGFKTTIPRGLCDVGLGCSVADVSLADVEDIYLIGDDKQIHRMAIPEVKCHLDGKCVSPYQESPPQMRASSHRVAHRYLVADGKRIWGTDPRALLVNFADPLERFADLVQKEGDNPPTDYRGRPIYGVKMRIAWHEMMNAGRKWSQYVIDNLALPRGKAKKVEMAVREFSRAREPKDLVKWFEKAAPRLEILLDAKDWPLRSEAHDDVVRVFDYGPFTVHNTIHLEGKALDRAKRIVDKAIRAASKTGLPGFASVVGGNLYLVGQLGRPRWAAWYMPGKDGYYLRPVMRGVSEDDAARHIIHEMGHAYWEKRLDRKTKSEWGGHHRALQYGTRNVEMPKEGDILPFPVNKKTVKVLRRDGPNVVLADVKTGDEIGKVSAMKLYDWVSKAATVGKYPSVYATKNMEEHFCEAVSFRAMGGLSPENEQAYREILLGGRVNQERQVAARVAMRHLAKTFNIEIGAPILYGKYLNKKGTIVGFKENEKGDVVILVEPYPKGRKQVKELKLFRVRQDPNPREEEPKG